MYLALKQNFHKQKKTKQKKRCQCGSSDNQKRATRNKAKKFTGVLNYMSKSGPRQWITEAEQQLKIIGACHADKLGGHFGGGRRLIRTASSPDRIR